jgi:hypothetical protein
MTEHETHFSRKTCTTLRYYSRSGTAYIVFGPLVALNATTSIWWALSSEKSPKCFSNLPKIQIHQQQLRSNTKCNLLARKKPCGRFIYIYDFILASWIVSGDMLPMCSANVPNFAAKEQQSTRKKRCNLLIWKKPCNRCI